MTMCEDDWAFATIIAAIVLVTMGLIFSLAWRDVEKIRAGCDAPVVIEQVRGE